MSIGRLKQLAVEMSGLCAELDEVGSLTKDERHMLWAQAADVISDMESTYGVITFRPEIPAETQKMFFTLQKFVTEG